MVFHAFGVGVLGVVTSRPISLINPRTHRAPKASEQPAHTPALAVAAVAINRRRVMMFFFFKLFLNRVLLCAATNGSCASERLARSEKPPLFYDQGCSPSLNPRLRGAVRSLVLFPPDFSLEQGGPAIGARQTDFRVKRVLNNNPDSRTCKGGTFYKSVWLFAHDDECIMRCSPFRAGAGRFEINDVCFAKVVSFFVPALADLCLSPSILGRKITSEK